MTAPKTSPGTATDHQLAFGSSTDPAKRRAFWVDELGTIRTEKLWDLVTSIRNLREDVSKRLEEAYQRTRAIPGILRRLDALEGRVTALDDPVGPAMKKKP